MKEDFQFEKQSKIVKFATYSQSYINRNLSLNEIGVVSCLK